ncbi:virulence protein [Ethanoligenens sp.]|uniref:virulence protein n=1 Tax=Ethanoligenens sp. TaxID=2099655 RepID=UPI0039EB6422
MELKYNVTGSERKSLVGAISTALDAPTNYLGAPTFAYEVGGYHIDKNGTVTGPDNLDLEDALHQQGFDAEERKYDEPDTYESGLGGMGALDEFPDVDQHHPGQYVNPDAPITEAMQRQLDEVPAYEELRMGGREELGLGRTTRRENIQGANGMQASDVPASDEDIGLVIEMPRASFTDTALENLKRLVDSKDNLIKKALGTETLKFEITDEKVRFPWFEDGTDPDAVKAYTHFVATLCEIARSQKRVTAKEKEIGNEKYAFRCFLLRLGFIGAEYKEERKILLKNLSGSSAFKNGKKKGFSQDDLDKAKTDPAVCAEIKAILGGTDDEQ